MGKPRGRNERERMSQSFRSLDATLSVSPSFMLSFHQSDRFLVTRHTSLVTSSWCLDVTSILVRQLVFRFRQLCSICYKIDSQ
jgi:hypothetical protein